MGVERKESESHEKVRRTEGFVLHSHCESEMTTAVTMSATLLSRGWKQCLPSLFPLQWALPSAHSGVSFHQVPPRRSLTYPVGHLRVVSSSSSTFQTPTIKDTFESLYRAKKHSLMVEKFQLLREESVLEHPIFPLLAKACRAAGLCKAGYEIFKYMKDRGIQFHANVYLDLMLLFIKNKAIGHCEEMIQHALKLGIPPYNGCDLGLSIIFEQAGRFDVALQIILAVCPPNVPPATSEWTVTKFKSRYERAAMLAVSLDRKDLVTEVLDLMHGYGIDFRRTDFLLLVKRCSVSMVAHIFGWMRSNNMAINGGHYSCIIRSFCTRSKTDDAFHLFQLAEKHGLPVNIDACSLLLDGLFASGDLERFLTVLKYMRNTHTLDSSKAYMHFFKYYGMCSKQPFETAKKLLKEMNAHTVPVELSVFLKFFGGLALRKTKVDWDRAISIMKREGVTMTYNGLQHILSIGQLPSKPLYKLYKDVRSTGDTPSLMDYISLLPSFEMEELNLVYDDVMQNDDVSKSYSLLYQFLLQFCRSEGWQVKAFNVLNDMRALNMEPKLACHNLVLKALASTGRVDLIDQVLKYMDASKIKRDARTYLFLVQGYGQSGKCEELLKLFDQLPRTLESVDVIVLNNIIHHCGLTGRSELVVQAYNLLKSFTTPDVVTFKTLISAFCHCKDAPRVVEAFEHCDEVTKRKILPSAMDSCIGMRDPKTAVQLFHSCQFPLSDIDLEIAVPLASALILINPTLDVFELNQELGMDVITPQWKKIINYFAELRLFDKALEFVANLQKRGYPLNDDMYHKIIQVCCENDSLPLAKQLLEKMPTLTSGAYDTMVTVAAHKNALNDVFEIFAEAANKGFVLSKKTYHYVLLACLRLQDHRGIDVVDSIIKNKLQLPELTTSLALSVCEKTGNLEKITELLPIMTHNTRTNPEIAKSCLKMLSKSKLGDFTVKFWRELLADKNFSPSLNCYENALNCCLNTGTSLALEFLSDTRHMFLPTPDNIKKILINHLAHAVELFKAAEIQASELLLCRVVKTICFLVYRQNISFEGGLETLVVELLSEFDRITDFSTVKRLLDLFLTHGSPANISILIRRVVDEKMIDRLMFLSLKSNSKRLEAALLQMNSEDRDYLAPYIRKMLPRICASEKEATEDPNNNLCKLSAKNLKLTDSSVNSNDVVL